MLRRPKSVVASLRVHNVARAQFIACAVHCEHAPSARPAGRALGRPSPNIHNCEHFTIISIYFHIYIRALLSGTFWVIAALIYTPILLTLLYKIHFFCTFLLKNLHMSENFCTFAPDLKINIINNLKNSQL